jgi:ADP-ribosylglycohydrolase
LENKNSKEVHVIVVHMQLVLMAMLSSATYGRALQELLGRVSALPEVKRRAVGAVIGAAVADAAARPLHWLYDRQILENLVQNSDPAFWPVNASPFYSLPTGRRSCYNDLGLAMLRSLPLDKNLLFDGDSYLDEIMDMFKPESEYAAAFKRRQEAYDPARKLEKREPIEGPWQQQAVTVLVSHLTKGEEISGNPSVAETDGFCSCIPLIARLACTSPDGLKTCLSKIAPIAGILSGNVVSMRHTVAATALLRHTIQFEEFDASMVDEIVSCLEDKDDIIEEVKVLKTFIGKDYCDANDSFGKGCANPGSFQASVLAMLTSDSFSSCVRTIVKGGGCNCSRANFAGACMGALHGVGGDKGIPLEWIEKTADIEEILSLALERVACE